MFHRPTPAELRPALGGDLLLTDAETGEELTITVDAEVLDRYEATMRAWAEEMQRTCKSLGVTYHRIRTDRPVESVVSTGRAARGSRADYRRSRTSPSPTSAVPVRVLVHREPRGHPGEERRELVPVFGRRHLHHVPGSSASASTSSQRATSERALSHEPWSASSTSCSGRYSSSGVSETTTNGRPSANVPSSDNATPA